MGANEDMEQSLRELGIGLDAFVDLQDAQIERLARGVALDLLRALVKETPVDLGWAQANWMVTLNTPDLAPRPQPEGLQKMAGSAAKSLERAGALNQATIKDVIWLTNAVPYITALADGHSDQAPNGWIELAVERITTKLKNLSLERAT